MLQDRVSNPGPLTYESGALPIALRGPASWILIMIIINKMLPFLPSTKCMVPLLHVTYRTTDQNTVELQWL